MPSPLADNPITRIALDSFGFRPYVEELHAAVVAADSLPLAVAVFGPWGSGKTTFLRMWEDLLSFSPTTRTIWFNPWKYDRKVEIWAALIQSLLAEMHTTADATLREKAARLARSTAWLSARGLAGIMGSLASGATGGLIDRSLFDQFLEASAETDRSYYRDLNRFELDFADAVADFVGDSGRLVVFVDDLDRCTPEAALNVLDALKLFLGDARCVFVLAVDFDLIAAIVANKYSNLPGMAGSAYMEKLIQVPFFLPDVSIGTIRQSLGPFVGDLAESDTFWELVQVGFGANPRRVKRFLNVLNLATAVATREDRNDSRAFDATRQLQLAKLLILRSEHRNFFAHLSTDPGAWQRIEQSPALPPAGSNTPVDGNLEHDTTLKQFLADPRLVSLLRVQSGPPKREALAPSGADVAQMLRTVRAVAGEAVTQ